MKFSYSEVWNDTVDLLRAMRHRIDSPSVLSFRADVSSYSRRQPRQ